jgi:myo-inositol-1(or 4)-monophosphatase
VSAAVSGPDPAGLAELACSVAREAGDLLLTRHGRVTVVETKSSPTDVVTEMDRAAEELIRRRILAARPGDSILGEEGGLEAAPAAAAAPGDPAAAPVRWIVDPLDGTVNYLYGLPDWAVSIAAEVNGTVVAGAVRVPVRGSLFTATAGGGAWLQPAADAEPQRLACNSGVPLGRALVGTGFGYEATRRVVQGQVVAVLLPRVRDIRRGGSAAVDLCSVAAGRLDAFYERGLHDWDFAAGGLIAREAGAQVAGLQGRPASESMTLAAGPGLFAELHDLLASLDPERDAELPVS